MSLIKIQTEPSSRQLAQFAIAWLVFFMGLSGLLLWKEISLVIVWTLAGLAIAVPLAGSFYQPLLKKAFVILSTVTYPIGWIVSHLLLAIIYYGILTPTGLLLKLCNPGLFPKKPELEKQSYWTPSKAKRPPEDYFKLY